jgi:hypothetical protein
MGLTRSDVIRSLINNFDEVLRQEVEKERKKWITMGVVGALESIILDPGLILRFIRRNVDILGYPDFVVGMVRVRNRVVVFSHHDELGHKLLQLVRSKIEDEVRREETEIEREGEDEEDVGVGRVVQMRTPASRPVRPNTIRVAPVAIRYKLISSNKAIPPAIKPTATSAAGKPVNNNGGSGAKSTAGTTVPGSKKLASGELAGVGLPNTYPIPSTPQVSTNGNSKDIQSPVGQGANHGLSGDFVVSLITNLYHKHRDALLKAVEDVMGG